MKRMLLVTVVIVWNAAGEDANFGKCFVRDGRVHCPGGCNSRAGLLCPRNLKKENCNIKPKPTYPPKGITPTEIYENGIGTTTATKEYDSKPSNTTTEPGIKRDPPFVVQQEEIDWIKLNKDVEAPLQEIDVDTCKFNGDCPCPLICCETGDGCPKRCILGLRLDPQFG